STTRKCRRPTGLTVEQVQQLTTKHTENTEEKRQRTTRDQKAGWVSAGLNPRRPTLPLFPSVFSLWSVVNSCLLAAAAEVAQLLEESRLPVARGREGGRTRLRTRRFTHRFADRHHPAGRVGLAVWLQLARRLGHASRPLLLDHAARRVRHAAH